MILEPPIAIAEIVFISFVLRLCGCHLYCIGDEMSFKLAQSQTRQDIFQCDIKKDNKGPISIMAHGNISQIGRISIKFDRDHLLNESKVTNIYKYSCSLWIFLCFLTLEK